MGAAAGDMRTADDDSAYAVELAGDSDGSASALCASSNRAGCATCIDDEWAVFFRGDGCSVLSVALVRALVDASRLRARAAAVTEVVEVEGLAVPSCIFDSR